MEACFLTKSSAVQEPAVFFQLGRYGDICLLISAFQKWAELTGTPTIVCTSRVFGTILEGTTYAIPHYLDCEGFDWHRKAGEMFDLAKQIYPNVVRTQLHGVGLHTPPDDLPSYSMTMWVKTGLTMEEYKTLPLVFDNRDYEREDRLVKTWRKTDKPLLLLNFKGLTSPMEEGENRVIMALSRLFSRFEVLNLSETKAHRVYDLLGFMDIATGLITVDTLSLHLSAASNVPVINYIVDHGQSGSIPKNNSKLNIKYSEAHNRIDEMMAVVEGWAR